MYLPARLGDTQLDRRPVRFALSAFVLGAEEPQGVFTRKPPQSAQAQMKYLAKQPKGTQAAAQALGVSQRTVERYVAGKLKRPREDLRGRIDREVARRWQP